jgi:hypothetical protein
MIEISSIFTYIDPLKDTGEIFIDDSNCEECNTVFDENSDSLNCAGGIATGTVVKDNRSIFWKNRHYSGENEKPRFEHGAVYDYWMNSGTSWGMNEAGLAVGNFMQYGTLDNWKYYSDATYDQTYGIQSYLLGHYKTVAAAAFFAAYHMGGTSSLGIVSGEPGVGAVVYSGTNPAGQHVCNITWINNTYMGLSNAYECDGEYDSKRWDAQGRLDDSYAEHGYIDWADVIQKGARDVKGREQGSGAFTSCCVSKSNSLSSIIAVSGDPRWNGSANIAWTCLARQPLVGIYLPLGASYLQYTDERDIPAVFRVGGGMEDYVDAKVLYATNGSGQGSDTYYAERVREIQDYTFQIENYSFLLYDSYVNSIHEGMSQATVEAMLKSYVDTIVPQMMAAYVNETYIIQGNTPPMVSDIPDQTITAGESFSAILLNEYVVDSEDVDSNITWSYNGNLDLSVGITNNIATITVPQLDWVGQETVLFIAEDSGGLTDSDVAMFTVFGQNNPPICSVVIPQNGATWVSVTISSLCVTIQDLDGDTFNWTIQTSPNIGSSFQNGDTNGNKICSISGLTPSTTYTWYVNATDGNSWTRRTYSFLTENLYSLLLSGSGNGTVTKNPDRTAYGYGEVVTLTAVPSNGWIFSSWTGDLTGSQNPKIITMNGNKAVVAHFSDSTPSQIFGVTRTSSNPLDVDPIYGWVNVSCSVTDNVGVSQVILKIHTPGGSWNNVSMLTHSTSMYYYRSTTAFSAVGNYSYFIWTKDISNNTNNSSSVMFSMPPGWDINSDGMTTILDLVLISNHYGETGASGWIREDVDNNGRVQILDMSQVSGHFSESW